MKTILTLILAFTVSVGMAQQPKMQLSKRSKCRHSCVCRFLFEHLHGSKYDIGFSIDTNIFETVDIKLVKGKVVSNQPHCIVVMNTKKHFIKVTDIKYKSSILFFFIQEPFHLKDLIEQ